MSEKIAIIGLGYVGLPLAVALAPHFKVTGFDISERRVNELKSGHDRTNEVESDRLKAAPLALTARPQDIRDHDIYIVTVPTPVDRHNKPDLTPVLAACDTLGQHIGKNALIVFESTVYPGVTEKICGPAIERATRGSLKQGVDFHLGYSPERVNPGDRKNTVESITKIVSADTPAQADRLAAIYGKINGNRIHHASSIMVAEAAKVVENAQRDINIAFINEISNILRRLDVPTTDVLEAMATKWNALPFKPGLVGGHCIGVDPFYLIDCAEQTGYTPNILNSARQINDGIPSRIADELHETLISRLPEGQRGRILMLGLTFKEDVPDLRNSKVTDLVSTLNRHGHLVTVVDPMADPDEAYAEYDIVLSPSGMDATPYDMVVGAVAHKTYRELSLADITRLAAPHAVIADIKGIWRKLEAELPPTMTYWQM